MQPGKLVIISGPSGAGKTTIVRRLMEACPLPLELSVSATTRPPRAGERDGVDYQFLTPAEFAQQRKAGHFVECFEVFGSGYWYGTLRQQVSSSLAEGKWVVLEIDVQGMQAVVKQYPEAVTIFLRPASLDELERRLRGRGTDSDQSIRRRLEVARHEWPFAAEYDHDVVNETIEDAVDAVCKILLQYGD